VSHSFTNLIYHGVWATKGRQPWLSDDLRPRVFQHLGGLVKEEGGISLIVNGMPDHVNLLVKLRQDEAVSKVVRALKAKSSFWIHKTWPELSAFAWQTGYGMFTVSGSQVPAVRHYIENQQEHHRRRPFAEEYKALLRAHDIPFKEEDLWE
jgi:REP element-mobilizing transposase RayT